MTLKKETKLHFIRKGARNFLKTLRSSQSLLVRTFGFLPMCLWNIKELISNPSYRYSFKLLLRNSRELHQVTTLTWMDRYPEIFQLCQNFFEEGKKINILSFGCSTGEEVLTLREYFPNAHIVGVDINKKSIAKCQKRNSDRNIDFLHVKDHQVSLGCYDAIFCMAVFQRLPNLYQDIPNLEKIYPFEKFETELFNLDKMLKRSGLLIIYHSNYKFSDTQVAEKYRSLETVGVMESVTKYDRNGARITCQNHCESIFVKLS